MYIKLPKNDDWSIALWARNLTDDTFERNNLNRCAINSFSRVLVRFGRQGQLA